MEGHFSCHTCNHQFASKFSLKRHEQTIHHKKVDQSTRTNNNEDVSPSTVKESDFWPIVLEKISREMKAEDFPVNDEKLVDKKLIREVYRRVKDKIEEATSIFSELKIDKVMLAMMNDRKQLIEQLGNELPDGTAEEMAWKRWEFAMKKKIVENQDQFRRLAKGYESDTNEDDEEEEDEADEKIDSD
jgi:hypothetical protein